MGSQQLWTSEQRVETKHSSKIMKLFVTVAGLLAAASAEPFYGYHQQAWPAAYGPGFSRTCYGCRGKRNDEAEPGYGSTLGVHPGHAVSYSNRSPQGAYGYGFHYGKRSADAEPGYGYGGGYIIQSRVHPTYGGPIHGSFAHPVGKRDAEAE